MMAFIHASPALNPNFAGADVGANPASLLSPSVAYPR